MERKNCFELLGLPFDPPINNETVIEKSIQNWYEKLENKLVLEPDSDKKTVIQEEMAMKPEVCAVMRDSYKRVAEAKALKTQRMDLLGKMLKIFLYHAESTPKVTVGRIDEVAKALGLQRNTVEEIYRKSNFHISKRPQMVDLNKSFISPVQDKDIQKRIERLRKDSSSGTLQKYPWLPKLQNLYDLVCYLDDPNGNPEAYREKRTGELYAVIDGISIRMASDLSNVGNDIISLAAKANTFVFSSNDNREKYDNTLRLSRFSSFFDMLKIAPNCFKKDPVFAENCIIFLQTSFPDRDVALALYNREAGMWMDPYVPEDGKSN